MVDQTRKELTNVVRDLNKSIERQGALQEKLNHAKGMIEKEIKEILSHKAFNLTIAMRIERTNYINTIFGKTGDLTLETINKLIKEGMCDAWFSIIQKEMINSEIADRNKHHLNELLYKAIQNLRKNDYEDNDSQTYHSLTEFVKALEHLEISKTDRSAKMIKSVEAFKAILCSW